MDTCFVIFIFFVHTFLICNAQTTATTVMSMTTPTTACCGQWSSWSITQNCTDMCGLCGNWTRTRTCTSTTCPCSGMSTETSPCNNSPCLYPRNSCCSPYSAMNDSYGNIVCASSMTPPPAAPCPGSCCPTGGMWSSWTLVGNCSDTCGGFGYANYTRTCLTDSSCPCSGNATKTDHCNFSPPCSFPRSSCISGYSTHGMNGSFVCAPTTAMPPPTASCCPPGGLWSPWSSWSNCTDSCGACGTAMRTRVCGSATSGCPCDSTTGSTSETLPCNRQPCIYPKSSCCSPYMPMNISNQILCWN